MKLKTIGFLCLLTAIFGKISAQQSIPFDQQYLLSDKILINPSYTGYTDDIVLKATYHKQWSDFDESPNTQTISTHFNLVDRLGVGAYFFRDENGPVSMNGINLSSAYHIPFTDDDEDRTRNQFSFGASLSFFGQSLDYAKLTPEMSNDPLLTGDKTIFLSYLNLGLSFAYNGFFGGVSVLDIPLGQNKPVVNTIEPSPAWYYLNFGYDWDVTDGFVLEPSLLMSLNSDSQRMLDLNLKAKFKNDFNSFAVGVSYRDGLSSEKNEGLSFTPFIQADLNRLNFSFGYNFGLSDIYKTGKDGFVIGLGYNLENFINPDGFRYR
ncbi:MAG: PorP/SprF family type IX secretion system membrane protein [Flavobacteriaceae bacterium]|jgi:type IX secretion system PorP/SprF family membrane protein|nr:PorP/SprF family type IX secretion system membrane protein [Flavobacteriaceae bacterium]